jgi:hypothetical protein
VTGEASKRALPFIEPFTFWRGRFTSKMPPRQRTYIKVN